MFWELRVELELLQTLGVVLAFDVACTSSLPLLISCVSTEDLHMHDQMHLTCQTMPIGYQNHAPSDQSHCTGPTTVETLILYLCRGSSNVHRLQSAYEDMLQRQALEREAVDGMAGYLCPEAQLDGA